jgi:hypothetical protein
LLQLQQEKKNLMKKKEQLEKGYLILPKFAKRLGYKSAQQYEFKTILKMLLKNRLIKIQQSGFLADSEHHHKLVVIKEPLELEKIEHISRELRVNFQVGDLTVHRATKPFKCKECKASILPGERYGSNARLGRRKRWTKRKPHVFDYKILCLPCLILKYDELAI